jgi:hypothetical protein
MTTHSSFSESIQRPDSVPFLVDETSPLLALPLPSRLPTPTEEVEFFSKVLTASTQSPQEGFVPLTWECPKVVAEVLQGFADQYGMPIEAVVSVFIAQLADPKRKPMPQAGMNVTASTTDTK